MINLIITPNTVRISKSKLSTHVFSEIYFQIGENFFPEVHWDDFSVAILAYFLQEACNIKPDSPSSFHFMDGPYYVEVCLNNELCTLTFISERYNKKETLFSSELTFKDFLNLLTTSANLLIRNLPQEASELRDVLELKNNFKKIQKYSKSLRA